jgi:glycosyltransferase involved in cell wall biosynthesis
VGGIRDIVKDGSNGFLVPSGDASAMADRVKALMENTTERVRIGRTAREFFEQNLSVDRMVDRYENIFREVVNEKNRSIFSF